MGEEGVEFTGRTVDDAISQAESQLGAPRDELEIQIVSPGSRGVFGIRAENARIRAHPKGGMAARVQEKPAEPDPLASSAPSAVAVEEETSRRAAETEESSPGVPLPSPARAMPASVNGAALPGEAAEVLRRLLDTMGFDAEVTVRSTEDPIMLAITGTNLGVLIGRRGDNLAALQFMVNLILSKNRRQWPRIVLDVENYRARREESLRSLADRIAYRVRRNGRPFTLEAMPAGDRRVIHITLRDQSDIETYSIGEGIARRVVIAPKRGAPSEDAREYR